MIKSKFLKGIMVYIMAIKILIDSASDITLEEAREYGVELISMYVTVDGKDYLDAVDLTGKDFYDLLEKCNDIPKTSLITPNRFLEKYQEMTKNGDQVLVITMSSKLSGTYNSAVLAAEEFADQVFVIDSLNVAAGERILLERALQLIQNNLTILEIIDKLNKEKQKVNMFAIINTLKYLKKGGRLSSVAAIAGELLFVKPIMKISEGVIKTLGNAIGAKKANALMNKMIEHTGINFDKPYCLVWSGLDDSGIDKYIKESKSIWEKHTNKISKYLIGSTIGTHVGPGVIGFAFFEK